MTRRILLVLLAFTAVVIAGAMVPLALNAISHDRSSFIQETRGEARTDAAVAQGRLETRPTYGAARSMPSAQPPGAGRPVTAC